MAGTKRSSVEWRDDHLEVIDQTALPGRLAIKRLATSADVIDAIQRLVVRGAPAIGVCAAFGVALGLREGRDLHEISREIEAARPTAVNLGWAVDRVAAAAGTAASPAHAYRPALDEALRILDEDRDSCRLIAEFGRAELTSVRRVLTHCNTGRLATTGIGTALGIVYAKSEAGEPIEVVVTETRPALQGARLTAWELRDAGIPVTLIADSAAGLAIRSGRVEAVLVGCDRVARNGDVANKIGTYPLAVLADSQDVPFYVAGPMSSFDPTVADGDGVVLETRSGDEIRRVGDTAIAPDVDVWNPVFDVTPANLVTAFITDVGVLRPPFEESIARALSQADAARTRA